MRISSARTRTIYMQQIIRIQLKTGTHFKSHHLKYDYCVLQSHIADLNVLLNPYKNYQSFIYFKNYWSFIYFKNHINIYLILFSTKRYVAIVHSQHTITNLNGYFALKKIVSNIVLYDLWHNNSNNHKIWYSKVNKCVLKGLKPQIIEFTKPNLSL